MSEWQELKEKYNEWRIQANSFFEEEGTNAYDCGNCDVRENFSEFVGKEVDFEDMLELERVWDYENEWDITNF